MPVIFQIYPNNLLIVVNAGEKYPEILGGWPTWENLTTATTIASGAPVRESKDKLDWWKSYQTATQGLRCAMYTVVARVAFNPEWLSPEPVMNEYGEVCP